MSKFSEKRNEDKEKSKKKEFWKRLRGLGVTLGVIVGSIIVGKKIR
jgi:hypothetical protein